MDATVEEGSDVAVDICVVIEEVGESEVCVVPVAVGPAVDWVDEDPDDVGRALVVVTVEAM